MADPNKPGWKTTEFWLYLIAILVGAVLASGLLPVDSVAMKVAGVISSVLGAIGYGVNRTSLKVANARVANSNVAVAGQLLDATADEKAA